MPRYHKKAEAWVATQPSPSPPYHHTTSPPFTALTRLSPTHQTVEEAQEILRQPDVEVTNQSDKDLILPKLSLLEGV